jgi:hypothetical protein
MTKTAYYLLTCVLLLPAPLWAADGCAKNEACSDAARPVSAFLEAARTPAAPAGRVKAAPAAAAQQAPAAPPETSAVQAPPAAGRAFSRPFWFVFAGLGLLFLYLYLRERPGRKEKNNR